MEEINPSVSDIFGVLTELAPIELAEGWDNPGLTIGNPRGIVKRVVCALDASSNSIKYALEKRADLLVTHHPLPLKPLSHLLKQNPVGSRIYELIKSEISFISMHTNLDIAQGGVNDCLCGILGLKDVAPIDPDGKGFGLLRIGELTKTLSLSDFMLEIREKLGAKMLAYTGSPHKLVKRIAVCGGSGSSLWELAQQNGADCLLTGELKHHDALDAGDAGFSIVAAGHFETERPVIDKVTEFLMAKAKERDWEVIIYPYVDEQTPINIFS